MYVIQTWTVTTYNIIYVMTKQKTLNAKRLFALFIWRLCALSKRPRDPNDDVIDFPYVSTVSLVLWYPYKMFESLKQPTTSSENSYNCAVKLKLK